MKKLALSQIFLLVVGIVAITYAIGSEVEIVNGATATYTGEQLFGTSTVGSRCPGCQYSLDSDGVWTAVDGGGTSFDLTQTQLDQLARTNTAPPLATVASTAGTGATSGTGTGFGNAGVPLTNQPTSNTAPGDSSMSNPCLYDPNGLACARAGPSSQPRQPSNAELPDNAGDVGTGAQDDFGSENRWKGKQDGEVPPVQETPSPEVAGAAGIAGGLWTGLQQALLAYSAIQLFGPMLGLKEAETKTASEAAALGFLIKGGIEGYLGPEVAKDSWLGPGWGAGIAVAYYLREYKEESIKIVTFSCNPWQPGQGGDNCQECNNRGLPCSEYQCRSLGQSCELVNQGTMEESCVWINRNDVNPPIMEAYEDALMVDYVYSPNNAINPPDRGVFVDYTESVEGDNCIPAFTPLRFGVTLNEPAKCKVDLLRKPSFEEMDLFIGEGLFKYNHSFALTLPGSSNTAGEGIEVENNGEFETYIRCEDANGNSNIANFIFQYCVDKGPDTTPPQVIGTSIFNGNPISFNQSSLDVEFYLNEPSECKWSKEDRDYDNMENVMDSCDDSVGQMNEQGLYTCGTTLTGMKNKFDNEFYIRCLDQPIGVEETKRNVNVESYKYVVKGTQPLVIDSVFPEDGDTVKDATDAVKVTFEVKTSAGFNEGESVCYYSDTGDSNDYTEFFNTNSHEHTQDLYLLEDEYEYFIRCTDLGGNTDYWNMTFDVDSDSGSPLVVRAYHEETYLKLRTIEEARCVYGVVDCSYSFDDGIKLTTTDDLSHFVDWDISSNLYIKCRDEFGNEPLPNQCSITAKTTDF